MDGVEPTQGFVINITEMLILLYIRRALSMLGVLDIWDKLHNYNVVFWLR
jgi:hypothetical protein